MRRRRYIVSSKNLQQSVFVIGYCSLNVKNHLGNQTYKVMENYKMHLEEVDQISAISICVQQISNKIHCVHIVVLLIADDEQLGKSDKLSEP